MSSNQTLSRVWFGPPGVGKSTYIRSVGGVDLEALPPDARRLAAGRVKASDIGAADTKPSDWPKGQYIRILVLPDRERYEKRRHARDSQYPHKANQGDYYDGFKAAGEAGEFDEVVRDFPDG